MDIKTDDPILRRASQQPDTATMGMWPLFAIMAAVALCLMAFDSGRPVRTASTSAAPGIAAGTSGQAPSPTQVR
jgi:hypothetical protein